VPTVDVPTAGMTPSVQLTSAPDAVTDSTAPGAGHTMEDDGVWLAVGVPVAVVVVDAVWLADGVPVLVDDDDAPNVLLDVGDGVCDGDPVAVLDALPVAEDVGAAGE
jgi:hypothetical protein